MTLSNEGQKITEDYLELTQTETEELSVSIVFGRLLCDLGEYDKSKKYFEQLLNDSPKEDCAWIEFNIGRALSFKCEWNQAREYYNRAYDLMMKNKPTRVKDSAWILNNIDAILRDQKRYDEALNYFLQALKIREKFYSYDSVHIAHVLNNIGIILFHQRKYDESLDYHKKAMKIYEKVYPPGHPRSKKTISKRSYTIQIRPVLRAVFSPYNKGSNTAACSIEYDNITPALRDFTADIRCPCMAVILPLLKRLNTA
ncbi:unnamed protein product [Rotaria magnacalcarata]